MTYDKDNIVFAPLSTHHQFLNLTDKKFARLTVLGFAGKTGALNAWFCECICGNITKVVGSRLTSGKTKSCGCYHLERLRTDNLIHGGTGTSTYMSFTQAKQRCTNPNNDRYYTYGERGIEFRFTSFQDLINCIGYKPSAEYSLERIDVNGHYEKGNIEWLLLPLQMRNRQNTRYLTINGTTLCVAEWAEQTSTPYKTIYSRLTSGWCDECAVFLPSFHHCSHLISHSADDTF